MECAEPVRATQLPITLRHHCEQTLYTVNLYAFIHAMQWLGHRTTSHDHITIPATPPPPPPIMDLLFLLAFNVVAIDASHHIASTSNEASLCSHSHKRAISFPRARVCAHKMHTINAKRMVSPTRRLLCGTHKFHSKLYVLTISSDMIECPRYRI